ncbi:hypothetical protein ACFQH6_09175 [Halobacteriaceae archaeon GCM10025711]
MTPRTFVPLVVALLVVLAGCVGGAPADSGTATTTEAPTTEPGQTTAATGDDDGMESGEWALFDFDKPATYTYDVYIRDEGEGTLVWDVQSIDGDRATVRVVYEMAGERFESTMTGDKDTVTSQLFATPAGLVLVTTMFTPAAWYAGQELQVGNQWAYQTPKGSASFAVTGTDTIAGVDCFTTEMRVNGTVVHEAAVSPALGLAPHAAYYDEDGTLEMELRLVSYEAH